MDVLFDGIYELMKLQGDRIEGQPEKSRRAPTPRLAVVYKKRRCAGGRSMSKTGEAIRKGVTYGKVSALVERRLSVLGGRSRKPGEDPAYRRTPVGPRILRETFRKAS